MHSPMAQFEIHDISPVLFNIGDHAIAFTNSTLYMFLAILFAGSFVKLSMRKRCRGSRSLADGVRTDL